jgi:hypothetical protein
MPSQRNVPTTLTFTCVEANFYPPSPEYPSGHSEFFAVYSGGLNTRCRVSISPADADQLLASMQDNNPPAPSAPEPPRYTPTPTTCCRTRSPRRTQLARKSIPRTSGQPRF